MLGFAMRAGKLILGTELVCKAMPRGKIFLVAVACSASAATKKKLFTKSEFYGIAATELPIDADTLAALLGKEHPLAAVAVTDGRFADEIVKAASI